MLSKLTFSLALVLTLAFAATSVMAQDGVGAIAANGDFALVGRTATPPGVIIPADASIEAFEETTPNLADLLRFGGTIELQMSLVTDNAAAAAAKGASAGATAEEKKKSMWQKAIISEIMWGLDSPSADTDAAQWIEIYNHTAGVLADDALRLVYYTGRNSTGAYMTIRTDSTAEAADEDADGFDDTAIWVLVDRVSTIDRFGAFWAPKGQSGNIEIGDEDRDADTLSDLISMYRKVNLKDDGSAKYKVKKAADGGGLDGLGDGTAGGSWEASSGRRNILVSGRYIGSPYAVHVGVGGTVKTFAKAPASFAATGVIINEVRNDTSEANLDWIELHYHVDVAATTAPVGQNLENWTLSMVTATKNADGTYKDAKDENFAILPKYKLQPGEYLVIYNRDPGDTILAGGMNIEDVAAGRQVNKGSSHLYFIADKTSTVKPKVKPLDFPEEKFLLLIRNGNDKVNSHEKLVEYAGNGFFSVSTDAKNTDIHPFIGWGAPGDQEGIGDPAFSGGSWGRITGIKDDGSYRPNSRADNRMHKDDWESFGFMGAGYDRDVDQASAPGTPGYVNAKVNLVSNDQDNAAKTKPYAFGGSVTISEVMYDAGPRWNLVQWIELYNSSMTETIDLNGWTLEIRNKEDVESYVDSSFQFIEGTSILPNQTLLLVSGAGANDVDSNRVYNLYAHHRRALGLLARDSVLLSRTGFYLKLIGKASVAGVEVETVIDEAGNVTVAGATRAVAWELPARDPAARQSLIRQYGTRDIDGTPDAADDGIMESSWKQSDIAGAGLSYYGHRNDISTPGFRLGGPLPVSLSSFRPVRDKTTGAVVIKWVTESELNNAGFNILRSESKDGEFRVVNLKGIIVGNGTTSERHVYKWTDTTAKPNVVYYYQIEDVSLDGNRTALATTHLRGNVTVAGKATTTWADLKSQK